MRTVAHPVPQISLGYAPAPQISLGATSAPTLPAFYTSPIFRVLQTASIAASVYHGYKRNNSVGWAIWWGLMGGLFPVITPAIAVAEGYGKHK